MRAYSDNVIVKPIAEEVSEIRRILTAHVPHFVRKHQLLKRGVVVSAGPGLEDMKMPVGPGNTVIFDKNMGFPLELNHEKLHVIKMHNIICAK